MFMSILVSNAGLWLYLSWWGAAFSKESTFVLTSTIIIRLWSVWIFYFRVVKKLF
jgi:hypothetical protein